MMSVGVCRAWNVERAVLLVAVMTVWIGCGGSGERSAVDGYPNRELTFVEDLAIGRSESDPVLFRSVTAIDGDADGNVYVLDSQAPAVYAFDPDGDLRFTVADGYDQRGSLQMIQTFFVAADSIVAFDYRPIFAVFDGQTGEFRSRHAPIADSETYGSPNAQPVGASSQALVVMLAHAQENIMANGDRDAVHVEGDGFGASLWTGPSMEFLRYDPPGPAFMASTDKPQGRDSFCAVRGELLYCAENDSLVFDVIRVSDGTSSRYTIPFEPLEATASDRGGWVEELRDDETFREMYAVPDRWRALEDLLIDDTGKLWMRVRVSRADSVVTWWVDDPQTDYRAYVTLPDSVELHAVSGSKAYARVRSGTGEQWAGRYNFEY